MIDDLPGAVDSHSVLRAHALYRSLGVRVSDFAEVGTGVSRRLEFTVLDVWEFLALFKRFPPGRCVDDQGTTLIDLVQLSVGAWERSFALAGIDVDALPTVFDAKRQSVLAWACIVLERQPQSVESMQFARDVVLAHEKWEQACRDMDIPLSSALAGRLMELRERVWWKLRHERAAVTGNRVVERQKEGRSTRAANASRGTQHSQRVLEAALSELLEQQPHLRGPRMQREAARQLEARDLCDANGEPLGIGWEAIRKRLRKKMKALGMH